MSETFLAARRARQTVEPDGGSLKPWLLGIATPAVFAVVHDALGKLRRQDGEEFALCVSAGLDHQQAAESTRLPGRHRAIAAVVPERGLPGSAALRRTKKHEGRCKNLEVPCSLSHGRSPCCPQSRTNRPDRLNGLNPLNRPAPTRWALEL
ncbi:hypothetical protein ACFT7S_04410 [Streptomyces sp. NPDC057136]|uniref:hypothetical protein n=1 Tax=Streptomyces sp. NPDC057136 TaxID=3346029 RepID=UPI00363B1CB2